MRAFPNRRTTCLLGATLGALLSTATALAGPQITVGTPFTGVAGQVGSHVRARGDAQTIDLTALSDYVNAIGHRGGYRYCTPWANSELRAGNFTTVRHTSKSVEGWFRAISALGTTNLIHHNSMNPGSAYEHNGIPLGGSCVEGDFLINGRTTTGSGAPVLSHVLRSVVIEDLEGPAVGNLAAQSGWVTGNEVHLSWDHADNGLFRGTTAGVVVGGGSTSLGDPANGRVSAWVPVGALPDGAHTVQAHRSGGGWATAVLGAGFSLDRNPPTTPDISVTADGVSVAGIWTNKSVLVSSAATSDGTGSGWNRNEINTGGVNSTTLTGESPGAGSQVCVRAVDNAGHASAWKCATVKIDKSAPQAAVSMTMTGPGKANGQVTAADSLSGVKSWTVRVNNAAGPVIATSANPSALSSLGDSGPLAAGGTYRLHVSVEDQAGNLATALSQPARFDQAAPTATIDGSPSGWVRDLTLDGARDNRLRVTLSDNLPDGLGEVEIQGRQGQEPFKTLIHYNPAGAHILDHVEGGPIGQGAHVLSPPLPLGVKDGDLDLRIVAKDPTFAALSSATVPTSVKVDVTAPSDPTPSDWSAEATGRGLFRVSLPGLSDAASGVGRIEVHASTNPQGGSGPMVKVGETIDPAATPSVDVNLQSFGATGLHATEIRAFDRAGNLLATPGPRLSVDQIAPVISRLQVDALTATLGFSLTDQGGAGFGTCPLVISLAGPGTGGSFRELLSEAGANMQGAVSWVIPMEGMPGGEHQVRISACDAGGNETQATTRFSWTPRAGLQIQGDTPSLRVSEITSPEAVGRRRVGAQVVPVLIRRFGERFTLSGRIDDARSGEVELRDPVGRVLATARLARDGSFTVRAKATRGGVVSVALDGRSAPVAFLRVRPILRSSLVIKKDARSQRIVASGTLIPKTSTLGKAIQLQYKDGTLWRPLANGFVARNGAFRISYRFRTLKAGAIRVRISVTAERGWPFEPVTSRAQELHIR